MKKKEILYKVQNEKNVPKFIGTNGIVFQKLEDKIDEIFKGDVKIKMRLGQYDEKKKKFNSTKKGETVTHVKLKIQYEYSDLTTVINFVINHFKQIENKCFGMWKPTDNNNVGWICGKYIKEYRGNTNLLNIQSEFEESQIWFSKSKKVFNIKCKCEKDLDDIKNCLTRLENQIIHKNNYKNNYNKKKKEKKFEMVTDDFPSLTGHIVDNNDSKNFWSNGTKISLPGEFNLSKELMRQKESLMQKRLDLEKKMEMEKDECLSSDFDSDLEYEDYEIY
jgi:hypothetical protein